MDRNKPLGTALLALALIVGLAGFLYLLEDAAHAFIFLMPALLLYAAVLMIGATFYLAGLLRRPSSGT